MFYVILTLAAAAADAMTAALWSLLPGLLLAASTLGEAIVVCREEATAQEVTGPSARGEYVLAKVNSDQPIELKVTVQSENQTHGEHVYLLEPGARGSTLVDDFGERWFRLWYGDVFDAWCFGWGESCRLQEPFRVAWPRGTAFGSDCTEAYYAWADHTGRRLFGGTCAGCALLTLLFYCCCWRGREEGIGGDATDEDARSLDIYLDRPNGIRLRTSRSNLGKSRDSQLNHIGDRSPARSESKAPSPMAETPAGEACRTPTGEYCRRPTGDTLEVHSHAYGRGSGGSTPDREQQGRPGLQEKQQEKQQVKPETQQAKQERLEAEVGQPKLSPSSPKRVPCSSPRRRGPSEDITPAPE